MPFPHAGSPNDLPLFLVCILHLPGAQITDNRVRPNGLIRGAGTMYITYGRKQITAGYRTYLVQSTGVMNTFKYQNRLKYKSLRN